ncbi:MAG: heavy-metal-associated domain-containing protein [Hyphomicrobiales bacterium]
MKRLPFLFLLLFASTAAAAERTATFSVPGMTCSLCPITVKAAMSAVSGVKSAEADFDTKSATAVFEDTVVSAGTIADASANAGYPATIVSIR